MIASVSDTRKLGIYTLWHTFITANNVFPLYIAINTKNGYSLSKDNLGVQQVSMTIQTADDSLSGTHMVHTLAFPVKSEHSLT